MKIWESSEGIFCICCKKGSDNASAGIGAIATAGGRDLVGNMAAEEGGVVAAEEESTTIMVLARGEGARWIEISTTRGDVVIISWETDAKVVEIGGAGRSSG